MFPNKEELIKELTFKTSRSGGSGGQHVNKVSSKVEVVFQVGNSALFDHDQKQLLTERLANKLDHEGNLHVIAQEDRSQLVNKEKAVLKMMALLEQSLQVQKKRKPTKIPKAVIEKRLQHKLVNAVKKEHRKKPKLD
ncbi:MAG: alternative ribosome rescue aminoacyl-tRNA hydrolase ArfB [Pedobacter sp.]|nr:alternative ribosome rescue aminoacyl-tRNA hydrolase ArfB [Pedobacter sp.]MDQ8053821.1 alternative ribosome rescue aminoacyl-tRNA hydrolase ArfB [Pedobacter sp.]